MSDRTKFLRGVGVINATPLTADDQVNEAEYRRHVGWLIENGIAFIQPHALNGQGMLSTEEEYRRVLELTVDQANGKALVTAYSGRMSTRETVRATAVAKDVGADAAFIIQPWFTNPDQRGLYQHFKTVADAVDIPIVIYNNPSRAGVEIPIKLVQRLASECPNIVGLKQMNLSLFPESFVTLGQTIGVSPFGDTEILWALAMGSSWSLSYSANVIPGVMVKIFESWTRGDYDTARTLFSRYLPLISATSLEPIPAPVKYMLNRTGWNFGEPRRPIMPVTQETAKEIDAILMSLDLMPTAAGVLTAQA